VLKFEPGAGYPFPETNTCPAGPDWVIAQYDPGLQANCTAEASRAVARPVFSRRRLAGRRMRLSLVRPLPGTQSVRFSIGRRVVAVDRRAPFAATVTLRRREVAARRLTVRATLFPSLATLTRSLSRRR
jgi:hypothetical protein